METNINNKLGRYRSPFTRTWQSTLMRTTAPKWGAAEWETVDQALAAYKANLLADSRALATLDANGISRDAIEEFHLGFVTREAGRLLPGGETYDGAFLRGRLQNIGLLRLNGHTHFSGSILAPVADSRGQVADVYGRKITPKLRMGSSYHLSIYDPPQGVFNLGGLARSREVVLCGDLFDALAFWSAGIRHVTTTVGPRGFTDIHMRVFAAFGIKRVVIAFPAGKGDDRIGRLISQALDYMGIECARMALPREVGNSKVLPDLVKTAQPFKQSADELFKETLQ